MVQLSDAATHDSTLRAALGAAAAARSGMVRLYLSWELPGEKPKAGFAPNFRARKQKHTPAPRRYFHFA